MHHECVVAKRAGVPYNERTRKKNPLSAHDIASCLHGLYQLMYHAPGELELECVQPWTQLDVVQDVEGLEQ